MVFKSYVEVETIYGGEDDNSSYSLFFLHYTDFSCNDGTYISYDSTTMMYVS